MKPEGKLISISPEIIATPYSDLPPLESMSEFITPPTPNLEMHFSIYTEQMSSAIDSLKKHFMALRKVIENTFYISASPNSRVKHLAQHAKKHRVRKKNIARLKKQFQAHAADITSSAEFRFTEEKPPEDIWVCQNIQGDYENDSNNN